MKSCNLACNHCLIYCGECNDVCGGSYDQRNDEDNNRLPPHPAVTGYSYRGYSYRQMIAPANSCENTRHEHGAIYANPRDMITSLSNSGAVNFCQSYGNGDCLKVLGYNCPSLISCKMCNFACRMHVSNHLCYTVITSDIENNIQHYDGNRQLVSDVSRTYLSYRGGVSDYIINDRRRCCVCNHNDSIISDDEIRITEVNSSELNNNGFINCDCHLEILNSTESQKHILSENWQIYSNYTNNLSVNKSLLPSNHVIGPTKSAIETLKRVNFDVMRLCIIAAIYLFLMVFCPLSTILITGCTLRIFFQYANFRLGLVRNQPFCDFEFFPSPSAFCGKNISFTTRILKVARHVFLQLNKYIINYFAQKVCRILHLCRCSLKNVEYCSTIAIFRHALCNLFSLLVKCHKSWQKCIFYNYEQHPQLQSQLQQVEQLVPGSRPCKQFQLRMCQSDGKVVVKLGLFITLLSFTVSCTAAGAVRGTSSTATVGCLKRACQITEFEVDVSSWSCSDPAAASSYDLPNVVEGNDRISVGKEEGELYGGSENGVSILPSVSEDNRIVGNVDIDATSRTNADGIANSLAASTVPKLNLVLGKRKSSADGNNEKVQQNGKSKIDSNQNGDGERNEKRTKRGIHNFVAINLDNRSPRLRKRNRNSAKHTVTKRENREFQKGDFFSEDYYDTDELINDNKRRRNRDRSFESFKSRDRVHDFNHQTYRLPEPVRTLPRDPNLNDNHRYPLESILPEARRRYHGQSELLTGVSGPSHFDAKFSHTDINAPPGHSGSENQRSLVQKVSVKEISCRPETVKLASVDQVCPEELRNFDGLVRKM